MYLQTLSDTWQIRPLEEFQQGLYSLEDEGWLPATVPGHWQLIPALERHAGKVVYRCRFPFRQEPSIENQEPEPVDSQRPDSSQFSVLGAQRPDSSQFSVLAAQRPDSSHFSVLGAQRPDSSHFSVLGAQRHWLRINGAFYHSRPYLNGVDLGAHEGYFIPCEREVTGLLQEENTLLVELDCPDERNKHSKRMITGVFSHWDCIDPLANPGGIWLPVELHTSGPVRLSHARLRTESLDDQLAQIRFGLDLDAAAPTNVTLAFTFTPRTFAGEVQRFTQRRSLRAGPQEVGGLVKLRDPQLWWTHDLGRPDLYDVTIEVLLDDALSDRTDLAFGVRRFELRNWIPHLNGVRFLAKGNNYPPGDMRIACMTRDRYDHDLRLARECHMNMLRVHAHVDHPLLYEAADETGMLLWQDFPLQWMYDERILPEAKRQLRQMLRLLGSHPCVAVWCMHNEPFLIEDTADESLMARLRMQITVFGRNWNRDVMDSQLKAIAEEEDPTRPAVRSSGEFDIPYLRAGTDGHAYFGWYRNYGTLDDAEMMQRRFPGNMSFMTEFGTQSFPNLESSLRFMPEVLTEADIEELATRRGFQHEIMANWIPWREAESLAEVIEMSQDYQIFINRYYIDRLRSYKYRPTGGILPFLFIDPYPAVLWSVVDYWRVPKRSYYAMQMAFRPQYAFCLYYPRTYTVGEPVELPLYLVNDAQHPVPGARLTARLFDPEGVRIAETSRRIDLPADSLAEVVDRLRLTPTRAGRYALDLELTGVEHEVRQVYEIAVGAATALLPSGTNGGQRK